MPRTKSPPPFRNLAELLENLGGIDPARVCYDPPPGRATKRDLIRTCAATNRLHELVEGTLVEKPMGHPESYLALELGRILANFVVENDLGYCTTADDLVEVLPGLVRGPDLSFTSWNRLPGRTVSRAPISRVVPDLVVEILSPSNTPREISRKLAEYFGGGVRMVWVIDPRTFSADVYTSADEKTAIGETGTLDAGEVVPGFQLPLAGLFARLEKPKPKKRKT